LLQKIINEHPSLSVLIFAMPEERAQAEELKKKISTRVAIVPPGLSLTESSAVIEKLALFITPDTSLVHIARSLSVPVVGLYSRFMSNFILWRPYGQDDGAVVSNCDGNIFDIKPDQVYSAFKKVYANRKVAAE
jgi:ADP-heptose:LPS heptosyltransferase